MKKILLYIVITLHFSSISSAIIEIDITEGNREPLPIAITEFFHDTDSILAVSYTHLTLPTNTPV